MAADTWCSSFDDLVGRGGWCTGLVRWTVLRNNYAQEVINNISVKCDKEIKLGLSLYSIYVCKASVKKTVYSATHSNYTGLPNLHILVFSRLFQFGLWHESSGPSVVCRGLWRCCTQGREGISAMFLNHLIAQGLAVFVSKFWAKIPRGAKGSWKFVGVWKNGVFRPITRFIVTVKDNWELVCYLSNSVISNDREWPLN